MSSVVNHAQVPSKRTGELYDVTEYDDGQVSCTCQWGVRRDPTSIGDRSCWHVRLYRIQSAGIDIESPLELPHIPVGEPIGFNANEWLIR